MLDKGVGLLLTLRLAAALVVKYESAGEVQCSKIDDKQVCKCEGREFGPGHTGNFVQDEQMEVGDYAKNITSFWDFRAFQHGKKVSMQKFQSKVALVVNVASACGYANAFYKDAADLLKKFKSKGFTLIAVPANQHEGGVLPMLAKVAPVAQGELSWNYEKFLVNEQGQVIGRFTHQVDAKSLEPKIKELLEL